MGTSNNTRLGLWVDAWKGLIAPIFLLLVGLGEFVYQAGWGHDQTFGLIGVGMALAGAGLGVDMLGRVTGR